MTRTVADAAILLGVLVGTDKADAETVSANKNGEKDYAKFLIADGCAARELGSRANLLETTLSRRKYLNHILKSSNQAVRL
jgi:Asp-tRNA(Asn)/Glu-tRNA(Gln) amidotransferase A subunit family amidase